MPVKDHHSEGKAVGCNLFSYEMQLPARGTGSLVGLR